MNEPLVSVIIPFYNRVDVTLKALQSAIDQTYKNTEIILINDGSTDDISSIVSFIESKDNCKLITTENAGPASARNTGIRYSKGEYIAFLDSDDLWLLNKLEIQIKMMMENGWEFSHTSYKIIDTEIQIPLVCDSGKNSYVYPLSAFHCQIATPTVVIKKDILLHTLFNNDLKYGEDTLMWLQISKRRKLFGIPSITTIVNTNKKTTAKNSRIKRDSFFQINKFVFFDNKPLGFIHLIYIYLRILSCSL